MTEPLPSIDDEPGEPFPAWDRLTIGTVTFQNLRKIISADNVPQVILERAKDDNQLLLTMEVYDKNRHHVAKLRRNAWTFNDKDRYVVSTNPTSLTLIKKTGLETLVEARVVDQNSVEITRLNVFTVNRRRIWIDREGSLRLDDNAATMTDVVLGGPPGGLATGINRLTITGGRPRSARPGPRRGAAGRRRRRRR